MRHQGPVPPFYRTKAWQLIRLEALARDHGLCRRCYDMKILTPAEMVHHVEPIETREDLALVLGNLLSLCNACHNTVHRKGYRAGRAKRHKRRARIIDV